MPKPEEPRRRTHTSQPLEQRNKRDGGTADGSLAMQQAPGPHESFHIGGPLSPLYLVHCMLNPPTPTLAPAKTPSMMLSPVLSVHPRSSPHAEPRSGGCSVLLAVTSFGSHHLPKEPSLSTHNPSSEAASRVQRLSACPADFGHGSLHHLVSQSLKISLSISVSHTHACIYIIGSILLENPDSWNLAKGPSEAPSPPQMVIYTHSVRSSGGLCLSPVGRYPHLHSL